MAEVPIRMPKLSMTMEEGEFGSWLVEAGQSITKGMPLAVVMTAGSGVSVAESRGAVTGRSRMKKDELVEAIQKANNRKTAKARSK